MKLLFICNLNKQRSPTAEYLFRDKHETKSAGLYAGNPVTKEILDWAEVVCVMEPEQEIELQNRFPKQYKTLKVICLNIDDTYLRGDPDLIIRLQKSLAEKLPR